MLNPTEDYELILARVSEIATPVHETIDDIQTLPRFGNGVLKPVVEVSFGMPIPTASNRSFGEEWAQPHETYFFVTAYAGNKADVRRILGSLMKPAFLIGWSPSINCSGIWGGGGTEYTVTSDPRPTIYASRLTFRLAVNTANQSL